jgi:hypothetical protein
MSLDELESAVLMSTRLGGLGIRVPEAHPKRAATLAPSETTLNYAR